MRKNVILLIVLFLSACSTYEYSVLYEGERQISSLPKITEQQQSVVYIIAENTLKNEISHGAGVVINSRGDILTTHHIIKDRTKIKVSYFNDSDPYKSYEQILKENRFQRASVMRTSSEKDLAILRTSVNNSCEKTQELFLSARSVNIFYEDEYPLIFQGKEVDSVGHPEQMIYFYSHGIIQKIFKKYNHPELPKFEADVIFVDTGNVVGQSGSPLFDKENGRMIGLIFGNMKSSPNTALAITVEEIQPFIQGYNLYSACNEINQNKKMNYILE